MREIYRFNLGSKRLKNAQLHDEIMRSLGDWGKPPTSWACVLWVYRCIACHYYAELGTIVVIPRNELSRILRKTQIIQYLKLKKLGITKSHDHFYIVP